MEFHELVRDLNNLPQKLTDEQFGTYAVLFAEVIKRQAATNFSMTALKSSQAEVWEADPKSFKRPSVIIDEQARILENILFSAKAEPDVETLGLWWENTQKPFGQKKGWLREQVENSTLSLFRKEIVITAFDKMVAAYDQDIKLLNKSQRGQDLRQARTEFSLVFGDFAGNILGVNKSMDLLVKLIDKHGFSKEDIDENNILSAEDYQRLVRLPLQPEVCAKVAGEAILKLCNQENHVRFSVGDEQITPDNAKKFGIHHSLDFFDAQFDLLISVLNCFKHLGLTYADAKTAAPAIPDEADFKAAVVKFAGILAANPETKHKAAQIRDELPESWYLEKIAVNRKVMPTSWGRGFVEGQAA